MGISKRANGHIQIKDNLMIGYAYAAGGNGSDYWGRWPTRFQRIELSYYNGELNRSDTGNNGVHITDYGWEKPENPEPIAISTSPHTVKMNVDAESYNDLKVLWFDTTLAGYEITDPSAVTFSDYDKELIEFDGFSIKPKKTGQTTIKAKYLDYEVEFKIYVYEKGFDFDQDFPEIAEFTPVYDEITLYKGSANGARHTVQVRGFVKFADGTWGEAYNDTTEAHKDFPAMVPAEKYKMTFESSDKSIVTVDSRGLLTAKGIGTAEISVTITGGKRFTVKVNVAEPEEWMNWRDKDYR